MPADLDPILFRADVVGVVDHPMGQPQKALLQRFQMCDVLTIECGGLGHFVLPGGSAWAVQIGALGGSRGALRQFTIAALLLSGVLRRSFG